MTEKNPFLNKEGKPEKWKDVKAKFEYEENVKEFTGLIFHCPTCDNTFHLHIAHVSILPIPKIKVENE